MSKNKKTHVLLLVALFSIGAPTASYAQSALGAIFEIGGKIGGALIDKAKDSMRDKDAEEKKRQAEKAQRDQKMLSGLKDMLVANENRKELNPYTREKLRISIIETVAQVNGLAATIEGMNDKRDQQRREEADRILSIEGVAKTALGTAVNTRVNQLELDRQVKVMTSAKGQTSPDFSVLNGIRTVIGVWQTKKAMGDIETQLKNDMAPIQANAQQVVEETREKLAGVRIDGVLPITQWLEEDRTKPIFIEYVDSPEWTAIAREVLTASGYQLAETKAAAGAYYQIQGEYMVVGDPTHESIAVSSGKVMTDSSVVQPPKKLEKGFLGNVIGSMLSSDEPKPTEYKQVALVVLSRQALGDKESRTSARADIKSTTLHAKDLVQAANLGVLQYFAPTQEKVAASEGSAQVQMIK